MWSVLLIGLVAIVLGFSRVLLGDPTNASLNLQDSVDVAKCLGPRGEVAQSTPVTLLTLPASDPDGLRLDPPAALALQFVAIGPVQFEILDPALRASVEKKEADKLAAGTTLSLAKSNGNFELRLPRGPVEVRKGKSRFLLLGDDPTRFGPVDDANYAVLFADAVKIEAKFDGNKLTQTSLPAGTKGTVLIMNSVGVSTLQPIAVAPWPFKNSYPLTPLRAAGQTGLTNLVIEARQPGLRFDTAGLTLGACAAATDQYKNWRPIGVAETKAREPGAATVTLMLPSALMPIKPFQAPVEIVAATTDGQYVGHGGFVAVSRLWGGALATLAALGLFWWLSTVRHEARREEIAVVRGVAAAPKKQEWDDDWKQRFSSLFLGTDNQPSLSLFQIFIWTVITVWGLLYVYIVTGSLLSLTTEMMTLLGIAGTGSVLSRWISSGGADGAAPKPGDERKSISLWEMLSTDGRFDLLKLQLLVFTLTIAVYVVWRIADTAAFPALDTNTLLLLGVSQGFYIGGKLAGTNALSRAQQLKLDLELRAAERQKLLDEQAKLTKTQADLKSGTPPADLPASDKQRLDALPELIKLRDKEIADQTKAYEAAVKELGLKPA